MRGMIGISWIAALLGLAAFYYAIPQLEITDSRYVIAVSDTILRSGSLDLRPLVRADTKPPPVYSFHHLAPAPDTKLPLVYNYHFLVRAADLPREIISAANAAGVGPFAK